MIGLFLITHGTLGESLVQCASHVLGECPLQLAQLGVAPQDDPIDVLPMAELLLLSVDSGEGALVLTDLYGATPANIVMKLLKPGRVEGVAGVSLPMLLRAITYRDRDMTTLVAKAVAGGRDGVLAMNP
ncbi:MAG: PTS fructose transporter subunit IIA [Candidatus Nitricoxidivorans perseverans]|uniref:PTS fructose transporter subunit IIA n=1 Tax=Candidatus Nitricoxidivorans perseverans TaxID=2975601 RepID=A0AA49FJD3_9PROT|nr:MAG: PTS fructose transporter subunit IIA [Candidatus Nitricoxidivorans perseverans]